MGNLNTQNITKMKPRNSFFLLVAILFMALCSEAQPGNTKKACIPCDQLKKLQLPDVTITGVEALQKDSVISPEPWMPRQYLNVPFCRVKGYISKEVLFELLMPANWNGRLLMAGNGVFGGMIQNNLISYINQGYAITATNTGHEATVATDGKWALNNMERQLNFGKLAVHRTAVVSKSIINTFYCAYPSYSYFLGCSRGGSQGMMEAQIYPEDFNGIVAGAPAYNWMDFGAKFIRGCQVNYPDPGNMKPVISPDNLKLLQEYVFRQCDALDGVKDKILNDPSKCKIDVDKLPVCPDDRPSPNCFTKAQLAAIKTIYAPFFVDGREVYPALPPGLEAEFASWDLWITGTSPILENYPSLYYQATTELYKYLVFNNPDWDYSKYDFKNYFNETKYASSYLDATQTDYSGFKKQQGKMIIYHGWNDPCFSAYSTIDHYEQALKKDKELPDYIRLFLMPGVLHCGGGTGPGDIDWVKQIRDWVENGRGPDSLLLSKTENGKTIMTRPVFAYPKTVVYKGSGDPNSAKSFKANSD